jgi:hypothetical protein
MSDTPEEHLGLDAISEPASPPPTEPDEQTRQDLELISQLAKQPAFRSVYVAERENQRLKKQYDDTNKERRCLQGQVSRLGPENAMLRQSMHDMRVNFRFAMIVLTVGSLSVGIAGAVTDPTWKPILLYGGIAASVIGLLLGLVTSAWVRPREPVR